MKHIEDNALSSESFRPLMSRFGARAKRSRLLNIRVLFAVLSSPNRRKVSFDIRFNRTRRSFIRLAVDQLKPLILERYPGLSEGQIREAHAYAYGGAVIHHLGYYPFGSVEFSNLVHYVRSGDFVCELLAQSQDANEYALPWARCRIMSRILTATPRSTGPSRSNIRSCVRNLASQSGTPRTKQPT